MSYIEELKKKLAQGAEISDLFNNLSKEATIDAYIKELESKQKAEPKLAQAQAALGCFTTTDTPDSTYLNNTTKIDISGLVDYTDYGFITDSNQTVTFSSDMNKRTVPINWATWSSPPDSESSTPSVLYSNFNSSITLELSKPSCTFGFELEPDPFAIFSYTVDFYSGDDLIGSITKSVDGYFGARLFAAKTCCCTPFNRVEISGEADFAIAQVRYSTDCSSECDCCCSATTPVTIEACKDSATLPLEITELKCTGRLLMVDVTVTACQNRSVIVGVIVCDSTGEKVLRFKACEACMPASKDPNMPCVQHTFNFCFVFQEDLCSPLPLNVKTIVEYACFDFPCNC